MIMTTKNISPHLISSIGLHNHSVRVVFFFRSLLTAATAPVKEDHRNANTGSPFYRQVSNLRPPEVPILDRASDCSAERTCATACLINYIIWINFKIIPVALLSNDLLPFTTHFSCHAGAGRSVVDSPVGSVPIGQSSLQRAGLFSLVVVVTISAW